MSQSELLFGTSSSTSPLIINFEINLRKTGRDIRTSAIFKSRQQLLDSYWAKFQDAHHNLVRIAGKTEWENEYFVDHKYDDTEAAYMDAVAFIIGELEDLNSQPGPSQPRITTIQATTQIQSYLCQRFPNLAETTWIGHRSKIVLKRWFIMTQQLQMFESCIV